MYLMLFMIVHTKKERADIINTNFPINREKEDVAEF